MDSMVWHLLVIFSITYLREFAISHPRDRFRRDGSQRATEGNDFQVEMLRMGRS